MRVLVVVAMLGLAVVFVVSFIRPRRSRHIQEKVKKYTEWAAGKARSRAGQAGDATADTIEKAGRATERVEHAGRRAHDKVFRSDAGAREGRRLERRYGEGAEKGEEQ